MKTVILSGNLMFEMVRKNIDVRKEVSYNV